MNITIFGTGYVGLVTGASLANLGHTILCVDVDAAKIALLEQGEIPFYEPGLKELVLKNKEKKRLFFTTSPQQGAEFGEVFFNCVGTPSREDGSADLSYVFSVAETVAKYAQGYKVLINKSTVPPGTARACAKLVQTRTPESQVEVVSNPEFLKQGNAVYDFNHPDKIVVGARSEKAFAILRKVYHGLVKMYIPFLEMDWENAEMVKYANNSFLATKISFINEIANISDRVGADITVIAKAIGMDYRIGSKFLNAGIGYGGSCFPKDVRALIHVAQEKNYRSGLLQEVDALNERQKKVLFHKVSDYFSGNIAGKTLTLWGLSFKPKTSDTREAPALVLIDDLLAAGAVLRVYDPVAMEEVKAKMGVKITYCNSIHESVQGSSAILLVTEWDEFRNVSFAELGKDMQHRIIFDGRNIYEPELVREEGFEYCGVGKR